MHPKQKISILIVLQFAFITAYSQFETRFPSWYPDAKIKTLFVNIKGIDTTANHPKSLMDIIKKNWKLSKVEFINCFCGDSILIPGNIFLNVSIINENISFQTKSYGNTNTSDPDFRDFYFLKFWGVKTGKKKDLSDDEIIFARAEFFYRNIAQIEEMDPLSPHKLKIVTKTEYRDIAGSYPFSLFDNSISNAYLNSTKGNFKNLIQQANRLIEKSVKINLYDDVKPSDEISKLSSDTLFVPNYWYGDTGTIYSTKANSKFNFASNAKKYLDEIFASYPYKIKLISREDLSNKILNSKKSFYYLNWVQSHSKKIVSIVNGFSGEIVYSEKTAMSFRLKSKDLERIGKLIN